MADWKALINLDTRTVVLPAVLDIKAAASLAEGILALRGGEIVLDASRVQRLGGQSLQVLLSAAATWHAEGQMIEFARPSSAFVESLALFGVDLETMMGIPALTEANAPLQ